MPVPRMATYQPAPVNPQPQAVDAPTKAAVPSRCGTSPAPTDGLSGEGTMSLVAMSSSTPTTSGDPSRTVSASADTRSATNGMLLYRLLTVYDVPCIVASSLSAAWLMALFSPASAVARYSALARPPCRPWAAAR